MKNAAYDIIAAKKATYYGIGMAMVRITRAILSDERSVLTVSSFLSGQYERRKLYIGVPAIVNRKGIDRILELSLTKPELDKFKASCDTLSALYPDLNLS